MPSGSALLDFGAHAVPGLADASVDVSSATITSTALVEAWIFPSSSADHTPDEHMVEELKVFAGNISSGVGFTIYGFDTSLPGPGIGQPNLNTQLPGLYGTWTIAWAWV